MNRPTNLVVRVLSLIAAIGITSLIVSVHAADLETLGGHVLVVSGAVPIAIAQALATPPGWPDGRHR